MKDEGGGTRVWRGVAWIGWGCEPMVRFQVTALSEDEAQEKALDMFEHLLRPGEPVVMSLEEVTQDPVG